MSGSFEDSSDSLSDSSDHHPVQDRRETYRTIRLCPLNVDSTVPSALQIINTKSYSVLNEQINAQMGRTNLSVLESFFGPWPWWKFPDDDAMILLSITTLYLVDRSKPFVLALLRTETEDRPLLIDNPNSIRHRTLDVLHEAMQHQNLIPELVEIHGSSNPVQEDHVFDYTNLQSHLTFPTTFYILSKHSKDSFKFKSRPTNTGSIPVALETTISDCENLVDRVASRHWVLMQGIHISRALLHLVVSLADADQRDYETLCKNVDIRRLRGTVEGILTKLDSPVMNQALLTRVMGDLESLFQQCCNDYPGAVAVRYSYDSFKKMGQCDFQEMRSLTIETAQVRNSQLSSQPITTISLSGIPKSGPGSVDSQRATAPPSTPAILYPLLKTSSSRNPNNRTDLNHRLQRYRLTKYYDLKHDGPQHAQRWRCFCYIGKEFVGCSNWCSNKDAAKEEAAGHALDWMDNYGYP